MRRGKHGGALASILLMSLVSLCVLLLAVSSICRLLVRLSVWCSPSVDKCSKFLAPLRAAGCEVWVRVSYFLVTTRPFRASLITRRSAVDVEHRLPGVGCLSLLCGIIGLPDFLVWIILFRPGASRVLM